MTFFDAIILGIVEGFTEFLPISSTAHLILTAKLLGLETSEFLKSFEIVIQLGAITAVVFLYWKLLVSKWDLNKKIITAFIPTAVVGLIFYSFIKGVLFENPLVSIYALIIGGVVLIAFEIFHKEKDEAVGELEDINYRQAFSIGLFQSVAVIPGVSRAAATILGGMLVGIKRKTIVEFSFLLAIPTMAAATGLDLLKSAGSFSNADFTSLGVGFFISFVTAIVSIKLLIKFIQSHSFISFGVYRIILGLVFLLVFSI
jgi:undecaprenyl-diphosphatase